MLQDLQFWTEHLVLIGIWVTLALSLNLINGYAGLFSLGHQGFWGVGAYTAAVLLKVLPTQYPQLETNGWMPYLFLLSFPAAMLMAAIFGLAVGIPCLRLRGDYLAIATLGFGEIFRNLCTNSTTLGTAQGLNIPDVLREMLGSFISDRTTLRWTERLLFLALSWGFALFTLILLRNLIRSAHGRAIEAIREDETAAELLGVNLARHKVLVFVLGAALAGLAGALYANYQLYVSPGQFNLMRGIDFLAIVVLGGMGSMTGTILATFLVYLIPVGLAYLPSEWKIPIFYDPSTPQGWVYHSPKELWQVVFSFMLVAIILIRPQGLMGRKEWSLVKWWKNRALKAEKPTA